MRLAAIGRPERTNQMPRKKNVAEATPEADITTNEPAPEAQPETATATEDPAPEAEPPKKPKGRKKTKVPSGNATLADIAAGYLAHMEEKGNSAGTIASYGMELKTAMA